MTGHNSKKDKETAAPHMDQHDLLGQKIRDAYADVLNAPLPERFVKLLDQLDKSEQEKDAGSE